MAANFWESTQYRHWLFTRAELLRKRQTIDEDEQTLVQAYPLPQLRHLSIYFNQQINRLGKRLQVRQQAIATAQIYMRRFYSKVEIRRTNPYLVIATAVYLACKMEECHQHIRLVVTEARSLWPEFFTSDTSKLGECEFFLISEMNSQLIVHHPYRSLSTFQNTFALGTEDVSLSWSIINDQYMTDLLLLHPPHVIALAAILLAVVMRPTASTILPTTATSAAAIVSTAQGAINPTTFARNVSNMDKLSGQAKSRIQKLSTWLAESDIDVEGMVDCTQEIISLYEVQEQFNEKLTREQINRFVKARGLDK